MPGLRGVGLLPVTPVVEPGASDALFVGGVLQPLGVLYNETILGV